MSLPSRGHGRLSLLLVMLVAQSVGCVTSEKSMYTRHLSSTIAPGPAPYDDLAIAFNLSESTPSLAAVSRERSR